MRIYSNPGSGSACVEATLSELDIEFERVTVKYSDDGIVEDNFEKINPRRQIPALVLDNGECLFETVAILMYLADMHPDAGLAPLRGTLERARLDQWMCFILANIYEGELRKNYPHRYVSGDPQGVADVAEKFVMDQYQFIENALGDGPYFFGDQLTILDIYIWMFVNWFEEYDEFREAYPKVLALTEPVMNRPKVAPIHRFNFGEGLGWGGQL